MAQVEFYEDDAGEYRWRVLGDNNEIVATGEGHRDEQDARRSFMKTAEIFDEALAVLLSDSPAERQQ